MPDAAAAPIDAGVGDVGVEVLGGARMNDAIISSETQVAAHRLDAGLAALALIANFYRIAADA